LYGDGNPAGAAVSQSIPAGHPEQPGDSIADDGSMDADASAAPGHGGSALNLSEGGADDLMTGGDVSATPSSNIEASTGGASPLVFSKAIKIAVGFNGAATRLVLHVSPQCPPILANIAEILYQGREFTFDMLTGLGPGVTVNHAGRAPIISEVFNAPACTMALPIPEENVDLTGKLPHQGYTLAHVNVARANASYVVLGAVASWNSIEEDGIIISLAHVTIRVKLLSQAPAFERGFLPPGAVCMLCDSSGVNVQVCFVLITGPTTATSRNLVYIGMIQDSPEARTLLQSIRGATISVYSGVDKLVATGGNPHYDSFGQPTLPDVCLLDSGLYDGELARIASAVVCGPPTADGDPPVDSVTSMDYLSTHFGAPQEDESSEETNGSGSDSGSVYIPKVESDSSSEDHAAARRQVTGTRRKLMSGAFRLALLQGGGLEALNAVGRICDAVFFVFFDVLHQYGSPLGELGAMGIGRCVSVLWSRETMRKLIMRVLYRMLGNIRSGTRQNVRREDNPGYTPDSLLPHISDVVIDAEAALVMGPQLPEIIEAYPGPDPALHFPWLVRRLMSSLGQNFAGLYRLFVQRDAARMAAVSRSPQFFSNLISNLNRGITPSLATQSSLHTMLYDWMPRLPSDVITAIALHLPPLHPLHVDIAAAAVEAAPPPPVASVSNYTLANITLSRHTLTTSPTTPSPSLPKRMPSAGCKISSVIPSKSFWSKSIY
jgi:hypothetical protein